jgi:hypothetical protein
VLGAVGAAGGGLAPAGAVCRSTTQGASSGCWLHPSSIIEARQLSSEATSASGCVKRGLAPTREGWELTRYPFAKGPDGKVTSLR